MKVKKRLLRRYRNGKFNFSKLFIIPLILIILIGFYFLINSNFFSIKQIVVETKNVNCAKEQQIKNTSNLLGQNIIFVNLQKAKNDLKGKFICIKEVNIYRNFPDKIKLQTFGREPVAILVSLKVDEASNSSILENFSQSVSSESAEATISAIPFISENTGESFLVDSEGIMYSKTSNEVNIPRLLIFNPDLALGQKVEGDLVKKSLAILEKVKIFGIDIKEAKIYSKELLLVNAIPKVIFRLSENIDIQLASLQLILNKAKIDSERLEFIDLRFDKPVIRFAPKKK